MPKFSKIHTINHCASDLFELVADVERYPEFVPMCDSLIVRSRHHDDYRQYMLVDMNIVYKFVRETLTSRVILNREKMKIDVQYVSGPLRYLENSWVFKETDCFSSEIHFAIDYQLKNRMLALLIKNISDSAFCKFIQAFDKRADEMYGIRKNKS